MTIYAQILSHFMPIGGEFYAIQCLMDLLKKKPWNHVEKKWVLAKRQTRETKKDNRCSDFYGMLCSLSGFYAILWFWPEIWKFYFFSYFIPSGRSEIALNISKIYPILRCT